MTTRVALVTGGTGGIGTAICRRARRPGPQGRDQLPQRGKGARLAGRAEQAAGFDFAIAKGDVSTHDGRRNDGARGRTPARPGRHPVNNAGITRDTTFHKMSALQWQEVINTNLNSVFNVTRPVIDGMRNRKWGRIVQISSINGQKGQYGQANYAAAKAGMHGFTISLAQENAKFGITVNTVSPGYVGTDMVMAVPEEVRAKIVAQIPIGRLGEPGRDRLRGRLLRRRRGALDHRRQPRRSTAASTWAGEGRESGNGESGTAAMLTLPLPFPDPIATLRCMLRSNELVRHSIFC